MKNNDKFKETDIKSRTCYDFYDLIKTEGPGLDNILKDEKSYDNILLFNISYQNLIAKPLHVRFNKTDGFSGIHDGTRYLVLYRSEKYDSIYSRIKHLLSVKSDINYVTSHNYVKIKVESYNSLPLEKKKVHNVIYLLSQFGININITTTIIYS